MVVRSACRSTETVPIPTEIDLWFFKIRLLQPVLFGRLFMIQSLHTGHWLLAASEGAGHLINSYQKYFKLASQKMMHITLEPTSKNFSWYASYELELTLNLRKQGMLKHKDS